MQTIHVICFQFIYSNHINIDTYTYLGVEAYLMTKAMAVCLLLDHKDTL